MSHRKIYHPGKDTLAHSGREKNVLQLNHDQQLQYHSLLPSRHPTSEYVHVKQVEDEKEQNKLLVNERVQKDKVNKDTQKEQDEVRQVNSEEKKKKINAQRTLLVLPDSSVTQEKEEEEEEDEADEEEEGKTSATRDKINLQEVTQEQIDRLVSIKRTKNARDNVNNEVSLLLFTKTS